MPFVNQYSTILFHNIRVGRAHSSAHQDYARAAAQPEIHPALKAHAFLLAHLEIRNDTAGRQTL
jgi:hypothetical protein